MHRRMEGEKEEWSSDPVIQSIGTCVEVADILCVWVDLIAVSGNGVVLVRGGYFDGRGIWAAIVVGSACG